MSVKPLLGYETVPLRNEEVRVAIIQSRLRTIDPARAAAGRRENLKHMLWLIDYAQARDSKDLLAFHEFPLTGLSRAWDRNQALKVAIEVPGPETDRIGRKAREYNCYIEFGCYARLPDWPRHFFNMGIIIGPKGNVIYKRWWLRNLAGVQFGTTVYDVLSEYVRRYGWDAVFPVARTDIGNLALMSEVLEPELRKAFAMRGAEIGIHYMVRGLPEMGRKKKAATPTPSAALPNGRHVFRHDFAATCLVNHIYGLFIINAVSEEDGRTIDDGVGHSTIYDCNGAVMAEAASHHEGLVEATLPLAAYRRRHATPRFHKALFTQLYKNYPPPFPPGSFLEDLPDNMAESAEHYRRIMPG